MNTRVQLPVEQEHPLALPSGLRTLRAEGAVHPVRTAVGDPAWLVTDYQLVRSLLADERLGRTHPDPVRAARTSETALFGGSLDNFATEWADHARMRAVLQPHFSPKNMRAMEPRVNAFTRRLLDDLATLAPAADLHTALALPLPILVICELLGVPHDDRTDFRTWTEAVVDTSDRTRSERGLAALFSHGRELVARKRRKPGDDVISRLCATDGVTDEEAAMYSMSLLFAGHETTVVVIGMGVLLLLADPSRWQSLRDDPDLVPGAVEEILRTPGRSDGGAHRYAREDLEIDGFRVHAGDLVLLDIRAANHDPDVFTDPDAFDPTRRSAHLSFGHGSTYCIGAPLARIQLTAVLTQLLQRFPTLRLAVPVEELTLRRDALTGGLTALPVTW